ncbi:uncharacterized protein N0V89_005020 [Didymosphaeria variabile]|uniref:Uncharacterized protein n=1 Tax=Didymosphaeria variabile TaxID=1932322 RepID=A0A9W8XLE0_9PLEO|nr:uncharacterized protein N0V89_005020 [Didymosphaeria variabile]KAJ4353293.1 hypothetical protein N0V89_005020 [Didymosphaeria variabile]
MRAGGSPSQGSASRGGQRGSRGGGTYQGRAQSTVNNNRGKREPNRVILVPPEFRRQTKEIERARLIALWKSETGCEVIPQPEYGSGRLVITKFEIFGTTGNLDDAAQKIEEWIRYSVSKTSETTAWAKIQAHIPKDWSQNHLKQEHVERKKKFIEDMKEEETETYKRVVNYCVCSPPCPYTKYLQITVDWPSDLLEASLSMKDAFGANLAKLDAIRMDEEVFIRAVGLNQLEICGSDILRARSAEQRLKVLIEKVRAMINSKVVYPKYILLDKREGSKDGVIYEKAENWWPEKDAHPVAPRLIRCAITSSQPGEYWQDIQPHQYYDLQTEIQRALDIARYEKGFYDLSIRLGCLALKRNVSSVGTKHATDEFMDDIINRRDMDFVVKHWLVDDEGGEEFLAHIMAADYLLEPTAAGTGFGFANKPESLSETKCTLRGTWVFKDPNASQSISSDYVVQVHWTMDEDGMYEKEYIKFYRLGPGSPAPKENIDIKLLELGESKGWQFSLTSMTPVSKAVAPTALRRFADQTCLKPGYDIASKELFADFTDGSKNSLKLLRGRLDKIRTFGIRKTGYRVDVISMWYPGKKVPCWGLNVYHSDWRTHLATVEQLRPGECASWGNTLGTFLPDDGLFPAQWTAREEPSRLDDHGKPLPRDGIRLLMIKLMELSQVIYQSSGALIPDFPAIPPAPRVSI